MAYTPRTVSFTLDEEHSAMLDAICLQGKISRSAMAKSLLCAVLDDDAAAHSAVTTDPDSNVIVVRHWRRRG